MSRVAAIAVAMLAASFASSRGDVAAAAAYSSAHGETALLVVEKGRVILERGPALVDTPRVFSITKSLVSIGVFRDVLAGGFSLGQSVSRGPARGVRLSDLLNQTSGLKPMSVEFYSTGLKDKNRVMQKMRQARASRRFDYGASHWEVLADEVALLRGSPLEAWLQRFVPGMQPRVLASWRRDEQGRMFFSTGARMSAYDLLPAAREVLAGMGRGPGKWPAAVRSLLCSGTPQNGMYALGFWLNRSAAARGAREIDVEDSLDPCPGAGFWRNGCLSLFAPPDLLAMIGSGGQRVYVVPSRGLAVIRLARGGRFSDAEFLRLFFSDPKKAGARG